MKIKIASIIVILLSINIYSQNHEDPMINPFWDFYSFNYLSTVSAGKGFTGIAAENDVSGFNLNPASIELSSKNQINIQYIYKTSQPWLKDSYFFNDMDLNQQAFSGSVGYAKKIKENLLIGFVYNNPRGMYLYIGEGTYGEPPVKYDIYNNVSVHSFNIPVTYKTKYFKLGLNLNYLLSRYTMPGVITTVNEPEGYWAGTHVATSHYFLLHAGVVFKASEKLTLGAKVVSGGKSEVKIKFASGNVSEQSQMANYPWKAGAGIQYSITKNIRVSADYNFTNTNMQIGLKDRHDGHIGIEGDINKNWTVRGGFFTLLDYRVDEANKEWFDKPIGKYDQYFITLGAGFKQKNIMANIAILTSQISSGVIKNTYINGGLTFNF